MSILDVMNMLKIIGLKTGVILVAVMGSFIYPAIIEAAVLTSDLSTGSTGPEVSALQAALKQKGFFSYPTITGYYGSVTADAVKAYQAAKGISTLGIVGPQTRAALNGEADTSGSASTASESPSTSGTVSDASTPSITSQLSLGISGAEVTALQQFLKEQGFFSYPTITGYYGSVTADAVKAFQTANKINPLGEVGPQTRAAIAGIKNKPASGPSTGIGGNTSTSAPTPTKGSSALGKKGSRNLQAKNMDLRDLNMSPLDFSAAVTWETSRTTRATVSFGTTTAFGQTATTSNSYINKHTATFSGLSINTTYYFRIVSVDTDGNYATSSAHSFTTGADQTVPVARNINEGRGDRAISISWLTDESATTKVDLGLTSSYGETQTVSGLTTAHVATFTSLSPNTTYHYRITSVDGTGNTYVSSDQQVATRALEDFTPPVISAGAPSTALALDTSSTTISVTTDESATCKYATASSTPYYTMSSTFTTTGGTSHSQDISGLQNGGGYTYYIKCQDGTGNNNVRDYALNFSVSNASTVPAATLTAPANNAIVSGSISLTATATDDTSVSGVRFYLDGVPLGSEITSGPYTYSWNTATTSEGSHVIVATARDGSGNYGTSTPAVVFVDNTAPYLVSTTTARYVYGQNPWLFSNTGLYSPAASALNETSDKWIPPMPDGGWAVFANFALNTGNSSSAAVSRESYPNNVNTIDWATVFTGANGTGSSTPLNFYGGEPSTVMSSGGYAYLWIPPSASARWLRYSVTTPSGGKRSQGRNGSVPTYGNGLSEVSKWKATYTASERTGGTLSGSTPFNRNANAMVVQLLVPYSASQKSVMLLADSIGQQDDLLDAFASSRNMVGAIPKGLDDSTNGQVGVGNFTNHGSNMLDFMRLDSGYFYSRYLMTLFARDVLNSGALPFTAIWSEHGRNDIHMGSFTDSPSTEDAIVADVKGRYSDWWGFLKALYPNTPIVQSTIAPYVSSSDKWTSVSGQTVREAIANSSALEVINDWIASTPTPISLAVDWRGAMEAADQGDSLPRWKETPFTAAGGGVSTTATTNSVSQTTVGITFSASVAPVVGEYLVIEPSSSSNVEVIYVRTVTDNGNGTYTVKGLSNYAGASSNFSKTHAIGSVVRSSYTNDGVHPGPAMHTLMKDYVVTAKASSPLAQ